MRSIPEWSRISTAPRQRTSLGPLCCPERPSLWGAVPYLSLSLLATIALTGCPAVQQIAQSAPPASPPFLSNPIERVGQFKCWGSATRCFVVTATAGEGAVNSGYQLSFSLGYSVLNTRTVDEGGVPVPSIADGQTPLAPPANHTYYFLADDETAVNGRARSTFTLALKSSPESPRHGITSVVHLTETSSNPQFHGTAQERATTNLELTYVDPGRCRIVDFKAEPAAAHPGDNITVSWNAVNCKELELYRQSPGAIRPGTARPELQTVSSATEDNFIASRTFRALSVGVETYSLSVQDALGTTQRSEPLAAQVHVAASAMSTGGNAGGCTSPQLFPMCTSAAGLSGGPPTEWDLSVLACSEGEAYSATQQANPGTTVRTRGFTPFNFCVRCPNGDATPESPSACTEEGARNQATNRHASNCQVQSGPC